MTTCFTDSSAKAQRQAVQRLPQTVSLPRTTTHEQRTTTNEQRTTTMPSTIATTSRALAIALTVLLFVAGSFPVAGLAFPGAAHWIAHLAAYAVIAVTYALGWQKQPALLVVGFVAALGTIQECSEIFTHHHALEFADILVDSIGAGIGVAIERAIVPATARA